MTHLRTDRFFKDKDGKLVVWQRPSLLLWVWLVITILARVLPYGQLNFAAALIAFGSLFAWAWLEITQGASYFRRLLGAIVLFWSILSRLS